MISAVTECRNTIRKNIKSEIRADGIARTNVYAAMQCARVHVKLHLHAGRTVDVLVLKRGGLRFGKAEKACPSVFLSDVRRTGGNRAHLRQRQKHPLTSRIPG